MPALKARFNWERRTGIAKFKLKYPKFSRHFNGLMSNKFTFNIIQAMRCIRSKQKASFPSSETQTTQALKNMLLHY